MAIKVSNLNKTNGIWSYDYSYDNQQKQLINDEFFDVVDFVRNMDLTITPKTRLFNLCDSTDHEFFQLANTIMSCPQSVTIAIQEPYKLASQSFRYVSHDFTWICTNIFRDIMKVSLGVKGLSTNCEIDPMDATVFLYSALTFIEEFFGSEFSVIFEEIRGGKIYSIAQPSIDVGIINNAFTTLSYSYDIMIIPKNFRKAIDNNTVNDINLECTVDGRLVMGRMSITEKIVSPVNRLGGD
jgi:hypothetical protein